MFKIVTRKMQNEKNIIKKNMFNIKAVCSSKR